MDADYRNSLIEAANNLIEVRHNLFGIALNVAMKNEFHEINNSFEDGDVYQFQLEHFENSKDANLQKLVELVRNIQLTVDFITNVNDIKDSELNQQR